MSRDEAIRLVRNIQWESADKDNMEFTARVSCYQRDAITQILREIDPAMTISEQIARDIREGRFPQKGDEA